MTLHQLFDQRSRRGPVRGAGVVLHAARASAASLPPDRDSGRRLGWSRRRVLVGAATAIAASSVTFALFAVGSDAPRPTVASDVGPTTEQSLETQPLSFDHEPGQVPRIVIDRAGFMISAVSEELISLPTDMFSQTQILEAWSTRFIGEPWSLSAARETIGYLDPERGYGGPVVILVGLTVHDPVVGVGRPATNRSDSINSAMSRLHEDTFETQRPSARIVFDDAVGLVEVTALGLTEDQFRNVVDSVRRDERGQLSMTEGLYGLRSLVEANPQAVEGANELLIASFSYSSDDQTVHLLISSDGLGTPLALVASRSADAEETKFVAIGGVYAVLVSYASSTEKVAMWRAAGLNYEVRGDFESLDAFAELLLDLRTVDEETWQALVSDVTSVAEDVE